MRGQITLLAIDIGNKFGIRFTLDRTVIKRNVLDDYAI